VPKKQVKPKAVPLAPITQNKSRGDD